MRFSTLVHLGLAVVGLALCPSVGRAQESEALCAQRPGQTTPPCAVPGGRLVLEIGLATWASSGDGQVTNLAAPLLRFGLGSGLEAELGWSGLTRTVLSDKAAGAGRRRYEAGDLTVGALFGSQVSNLAYGVQGFVSLPAGEGRATAGDWGAGVRLPLSWTTGGAWQVSLTPELDLAVDGDGRGRHVATGGAAGLSRSLSESVSAGIDVSVLRDRDPAGASTRALLGTSLAWQTGPDTQLDFGLGFGLTKDSPHTIVSIGVTRRR